MSLHSKDARMSFLMLTPPVLIVFMIVLFPILMNVWVAFKDIGLADLQPPNASVRVRVDSEEEIVRFEVTNRSRNPIDDVFIEAEVPDGIVLEPATGECDADGRIECQVGALDSRDETEFTFTIVEGDETDILRSDVSDPNVTTEARHPIMAKPFTLRNFQRVIGDTGFALMVLVTISYAFLGTAATVILGLVTALLMAGHFRGRGILRGLLLFPYVAPIIAVTLTWSFLLDPSGGTVNAILQAYGVIEMPISFFTQRIVEIGGESLTIPIPLAFVSVVLFEGWRYFPFAFLFFLSRISAINNELPEAAKIDGAGPFQIFWYITRPEIVGVMGTLFLLRFIWTFNNFDNIFLLTGGAAGTMTIPVRVYDYGFARGQLGMAAALGLILFVVLVGLLLTYFGLSRRSADS